MTSPSIHAHAMAVPALRGILQKVLLAAGVLSSAVYVAADQVCALRFPGYSIRDQVISEFSAQGAATAPLWSAFMMFFGVLFLLFVAGVLLASTGNRTLRLDAYVLLGFAVVVPVLWSLVPMHPRGQPGNWQDVGHVIMGAVSVLWITAFIMIGAFALGPAFRRYSLASAVVVLLSGAATFVYVPLVIANQPTPWLGIIERITLYGYLLWVAVLAVALLRRAGAPGQSARGEAASQRRSAA